MSQWRADAAMFGKAPWHTEFLRPSRPSKELYAFDEWLFRNASAMSLGAAARNEGASYGFLLQVAPTENPRSRIVGVLEPSCDRAGRSYPLAIAAAIELYGPYPHVAPIVMEGYWDDALDVLASIRSGPLRPGDASLLQLTSRPVDDVSEAHELYLDWTRNTTARDLCGLLSRSPSWLDYAIRTATESASAALGSSLAAVRVPLGAGAGGALCFWIDVLERAGAGRGHGASFLWSFDGHSGEALLYLQPPADVALATLWRVTDATRDICDLTAPVGETDEACTDSPSPGTAPIHDGEESVSALLERVQARAATRS